MSPVLITKHQEAPNIDSGSYLLRLASVRQVQVDDFERPGERVERIELGFEVLDHPRWSGAQFTDLCTPRLGSKTKLGQLASALNAGSALPDGDVDLEDFLGKRVRASVRLKANGFNQVIAETAVPVEPTDEVVS